MTRKMCWDVRRYGDGALPLGMWLVNKVLHSYSDIRDCFTTDNPEAFQKIKRYFPEDFGKIKRF